MWEKSKANPSADGSGLNGEDPEFPEGKKAKRSRDWKAEQDRSKRGGRGRGWDGGRGRGRGGDQDMGYDGDRGRGRGRGGDQDRGYDGGRGRGRGGDQDRGYDGGRGRGRGGDQDRGYDGGRGRGRGGDQDRGYDGGRGRGRSDQDWGYDGDRGRERGRGGNRVYDRDRRTQQYDDRYGRQDDRGYDDYSRQARDDRARSYADQDEYSRRGGSYSREEDPYSTMRRRDDRSSDRREHGEQQHSTNWGASGRYDALGPRRPRTPPPPPTISNMSVPPAPPHIAPVEGLSSGTTGTLLMKLATCSVKNDGDADLATDVIVLLVKRLKEYNHVISSTGSVHLLDDVAVKINVMKSLQKHEDPKPPASVGAQAYMSQSSLYNAHPYPRRDVQGSIQTLRGLIPDSNM